MRGCVRLGPLVEGASDVRPKKGDVLSEETEAKIKALADSAVAAMDRQDFVRAKGDATAALELFPDPLEGWTSSFLLSLIAFEAEMGLGNHQVARVLVEQTAGCTGADRATVAVMRGRVKLELGDEQGAAAEFLQGLLKGGAVEFEGVDPKYFAFAEEHLKPPEGCKSWKDFDPKTGAAKKKWWRFW